SRGYDNRQTAVGNQAAIEQMERLDHPSRGMIIGHRHGSVAKLSGGIQVGPIALGYRDRAEMIVGGPVAIHMALGDEGIVGVDAEQAVARVAPPRFIVAVRRKSPRPIACWSDDEAIGLFNQVIPGLTSRPSRSERWR